MSYQLLDNLFSKDSRPRPRETMKRTQTQWTGASIPLTFMYDRNQVNTNHHKSC